MDLLESLFPRLEDPADTYERWRTLAERFGVSGVQVHDARLVAVMLGHRISTILTFNVRDFLGYREAGIQALHPRDA